MASDAGLSGIVPLREKAVKERKALVIVRDITERKRAEAEAERRRGETEVLAELAGTVNASLDMDTVLQRVVEGATELCGRDPVE